MPKKLDRVDTNEKIMMGDRELTVVRFKRQRTEEVVHEDNVTILEMCRDVVNVRGKIAAATIELNAELDDKLEDLEEAWASLDPAQKKDWKDEYQKAKGK